MVRVLTVDDIKTLIQKVGLEELMHQLLEVMTSDYKRWEEFNKTPRHATHYPHGVIELMPVSDQEYYAFKYVNGHPENPKTDNLTVMALGQLAEVKTGYPLLISEMTVLTAVRTAVASALAAKYMARANSASMGLIGTGSQSEFQALAFKVALGIKKLRYYDIDSSAMAKFEKNMSGYGLELTPGKDIADTTDNVDIVTTATAAKMHGKVLHWDLVHPGQHINGVGGDCPGKTELGSKLLHNGKIVVEYLEQAKIEGEIQNLDNAEIYAELWEVVTGKKPGRDNDEEITIFDSVGIALEDYSMLRLVNQLAEQHNIGTNLPLIPKLDDPKNLFGLLLR
jgi:ornithine cyclodeaminase